MTDVPYPDMKIHDGTKTIISSDKWIEWFEPLAREIQRVLKPTGSFVTTFNSKVDRGLYFEWCVWMKKTLGMKFVLPHYWIKENVMPGDLKKFPFPRDGVDPILWFSKSEDYFCDVTAIDDWTVYNSATKVPTNLIYASVKQDSAYWQARKNLGIDHAGKYPELIPHLFIRMLTVSEDIVLETFNGTGTTSLVAARLGRECVAFEKNPHNVALAKEVYNISGCAFAVTDKVEWKY